MVKKSAVKARDTGKSHTSLQDERLQLKFAIIGRKLISKESQVGISVFPTVQLNCGVL